MKGRFFVYNLFFIIMMFPYVFSCQYSQNKNQTRQLKKQTKINIAGTDKSLVSKVASEIKSLKPVEPYKAKGIKEKDQYIIRKEGKKK